MSKISVEQRSKDATFQFRRGARGNEGQGQTTQFPVVDLTNTVVFEDAKGNKVEISPQGLCFDKLYVRQEGKPGFNIDEVVIEKFAGLNITKSARVFVKEDTCPSCKHPLLYEDGECSPSCDGTLYSPHCLCYCWKEIKKPKQLDTYCTPTEIMKVLRDLYMAGVEFGKCNIRTKDLESSLRNNVLMATQDLGFDFKWEDMCRDGQGYCTHCANKSVKRDHSRSCPHRDGGSC